MEQKIEGTNPLIEEMKKGMNKEVTVYVNVGADVKGFTGILVAIDFRSLAIVIRSDDKKYTFRHYLYYERERSYKPNEKR